MTFRQDRCRDTIQGVVGRWDGPPMIIPRQRHMVAIEATFLT